MSPSPGSGLDCMCSLFSFHRSSPLKYTRNSIKQKNASWWTPAAAGLPDDRRMVHGRRGGDPMRRKTADSGWRPYLAGALVGSAGYRLGVRFHPADGKNQLFGRIDHLRAGGWAAQAGGWAGACGGKLVLHKGEGACRLAIHAGCRHLFRSSDRSQGKPASRPSYPRRDAGPSPVPAPCCRLRLSFSHREPADVTGTAMGSGDTGISVVSVNPPPPGLLRVTISAVISSTVHPSTASPAAASHFRPVF